MTGHVDFFRQRPREGMQLILLVLCFIWQSGIAVAGYIFYLFFIQLLKCQWWMAIAVGAGSLTVGGVSDYLWHTGHLTLVDFLRHSFKINLNFWKINLFESVPDGVLYLVQGEFLYLLGFGFLIAGIFCLIDLAFLSPHLKDMQALQRKQFTPSYPTIKNDFITQQLIAMDEDYFDGTVIGVSIQNAEPVVISDKHLNQIALVLGTTGAGKTITMRRFYRRAITQGHPLLIVDGKPTDENVEWVRALSEEHGRTFDGFNCSNRAHYDALANGGYTELKDKIITLKDEWASDYYRSIAEDYLQTTFEVLIASGNPFDLKEAARCLTYEYLCDRVRQARNTAINPMLEERVSSLERYDKKEITGLQAHLNILLHSELGAYFEKDETTFNLADVIAKNGVVYFALPALKFPSFSKVLGKLVANDLKAVIDHQITKGKKIFTVFDEYSVFAGEQSLNLANMGREKGLHVIFGTQGLADLEKIDKTFMQQITNCANTIICHRLNDHVSAELVSQWGGTEKKVKVTAQINVEEASSGAGSVREAREFIIHPDSIKQELATGEAFYITKVDGFKFDKVKIKLS